ncbi:MAG: hypothetical protein HYX97_01970 [Chloroflexi bacterium]|nr:hypothetical protein [Chloroflexota bacterium]
MEWAYNPAAPYRKETDEDDADASIVVSTMALKERTVLPSPFHGQGTS